MRVLIVEDEDPAVAKLERMIMQLKPEIEIVGKVRSVKDGLSWFAAHKMPDLIFMDIHLLDGTCFEMLKFVKVTCPVIFTTAFDQYAMDAFQVNSVDYLLKPFNLNKLKRAFVKLESARSAYSIHEDQTVLSAVISAMDQRDARSTYRTRFLIRSGSRLFPLSVSLIAYIYSEDRMTFIVTAEGNRHSVGSPLEELNDQLDPVFFFRINRQMILHSQSIKVAHKYFKGRLKIDLIPPYDNEVFVSSRRATDFQNWLDK